MFTHRSRFSMLRSSFVPALSLLLTLTAGRALFAQEAISLDGRRLRLGVDSLEVFLVRGADTTRTGMIRDRLEMFHSPEGPLLRRIYTTADQVLGAGVDSITDRLPTLAPVRHRGPGPKFVQTLDFVPGRVTGSVAEAGKPAVPVNYPVPATVYNASTLDLVLRSADLREGWRAEVPIALALMESVARMPAAVVGVESVDGHPCWRVDANYFGMKVSFYIDQTTRQLRRQVMQIGPDEYLLLRSMKSVEAPLPGSRGGLLISRDSFAVHYTAAHSVWNNPRMSGPYPRDLIPVAFKPAATQADRQAAMALVNGRFIGSIGPYDYLLIEGDSRGTALWAAIDRLRALPQVEDAGPDVSGNVRVPSIPRPKRQGRQ
jgi:hypothetical protein